MARYIGPKSKIARRFGQPIFGADKVLSRRNFPPGQHGNNRRRKQSEYAVMLAEKQKAKYTYGVLERQFRNMFEKAAKAEGITGEVLLQNLESRLDNIVFRLGIAPTRAAARQLVSHKHIVVDGNVVNIPSYSVKPGQVVGATGIPGLDDPADLKQLEEDLEKLIAFLQLDEDERQAYLSSQNSIA